MSQEERNHRIGASYDPKHIEILKQIQSDNKKSSKAIGEQVGLGQPRIGQIINEYMDSGHISANKAILNPVKFGLVTAAYVAVSLKDSSKEALHNTAHQISQQKFTQIVQRVSGRFSLIVRVRCRDNDQLSEFIYSIKELENIVDTETMFVLESFKDTLDISIE